MRTTRALGVAASIAGAAVLALLGTRAPLFGQAQNRQTIDWPLHNLDLRNSRFAPFDDINTQNVAALVERWQYSTSAADNITRGTPLVVDGVLYFNSGSKLFAVEGATGKELWVTQIEPPFPASGRGPAYADGRI